jgi:hypothetical protein
MIHSAPLDRLVRSQELANPWRPHLRWARLLAGPQEVVLQQDWLWRGSHATRAEVGLPPGEWAPVLPDERIKHTIVQQIDAVWNRRITLAVTDARPSSTGQVVVPLRFQVRWVSSHPHWEVKVVRQRRPRPVVVRSKVFYDGQVILFNADDLAPRAACNESGVCSEAFLTAPHEFGHAIMAGVAPGGVAVGGSLDEYNSWSLGLRDPSSIMNVGRAPSERHVWQIARALETMLPGTRCSVWTVDGQRTPFGPR